MPWDHGQGRLWGSETPLLSTPSQNTLRVSGLWREWGGRKNWHLPREGDERFALILREASEKCFKCVCMRQAVGSGGLSSPLPPSFPK
ncbi:EF-hand domain family, member D2, isoform CRA_b [Homo sapiens]|nr:EF-hand domain family, member D2, isoform CRA_b [Homo sapiens]EAW51722.1 EF-hand domain family, member D2, isoform CRA_b [Homo sapiens]